MLVLALDTTTRGGSVAVVRGDVVLALIEGDVTRTHGERLPGELEAALAQSGIALRALDLLAVASGPGAFTGLRIGLAAMQGLAMVAGKPVIGISALDALADAVWQDDARVPRLATWMDAQRGEVFAAWYDYTAAAASANRTEPIVAAPAAVLADAPFARQDDTTFVGDGALRYHATIVEAWGSRGRVLDHVPPLAPAIARLGQRLAAAGGAGPPHALQPLYVRRPDAELERERQDP